MFTLKQFVNIRYIYAKEDTISSKSPNSGDESSKDDMRIIKSVISSTSDISERHQFGE